MTAKKLRKYFIVKVDDINKVTYNNDYIAKCFTDFVKSITDYRKSKNKILFNKYIICNQDEPYAEKVWKVILDGENDKQK